MLQLSTMQKYNLGELKMGIDKANKYNLQRAYGLSRKRKKEEKKQSRKKFRDIGKQQAKGEY